MTGLDKITNKILSEAQTEAQKTIAEAESKCDAIAREYRARAEQIRERISQQAQREGENIVTRAKSGAAMDKRNILLGARAELIDSTFEEAYKTLCRLPGDEYCALLVKLLSDALLSLVEERETNLRLYGSRDAVTDGDPVPDDERYEVLFNKTDRDTYGEQVLSGVRRTVVGRVDPLELDKLVLSDRTVSMDGGVVLKYGDVETNCSLEMVFAQTRDRLEGEVSRVLFD